MPSSKVWAPFLALLIGGLPGWLALCDVPGADADWPAVARHIGNVAATLGSSLYAASLVLVLRVSWLERLFGGLNNLYLSHHLTGVAAFLVLLLHPLGLALSHAVGSSAATALVATAPSFERPALLTGWIALVWLMAMMIGTFYVHLSYITWKWLHATSGLAFAIAVAHVIWSRPTMHWDNALLAVWATTGIVAVTWRLLLDRGRVSGHRYIVSEVRQLSDSIVEVALRPLSAPIQFSAGQFVFIAFYDYKDYRGCAEYHPFTLTSAPESQRIQIIAKALGDCTTRMQSLRPGVPARVQGPFGVFAKLSEAERPQIWIAGGIGITPFLSMAKSLKPGGPPVDLYYATDTSADAISLPQLQQSAARSHRLRVITLVADEAELLTAERISAESGTLTDKEFFMCGPAGMVQAISAQLRSLGVPATALHSEHFDFR